MIFNSTLVVSVAIGRPTKRETPDFLLPTDLYVNEMYLFHEVGILFDIN